MPTGNGTCGSGVINGSDCACKPSASNCSDRVGPATGWTTKPHAANSCRLTIWSMTPGSRTWRQRTFSITGRNSISPAFAWGCGRLPEREALFGVSLLPALAAQRLAYERKLELAHAGELSRPWSCLAACASAACSQELLSDHYDPDSHEGWADTLAMRVALSFHSLQLQSLHLDLSMAGLPPASPQLPERPPPYVRALLDAKTGSAVRLPSRVGAATVFRSD